jgi:hypothetical protein
VPAGTRTSRRASLPRGPRVALRRVRIHRSSRGRVLLAVPVRVEQWCRTTPLATVQPRQRGSDQIAYPMSAPVLPGCSTRLHGVNGLAAAISQRVSCATWPARHWCGLWQAWRVGGSRDEPYRLVMRRRAARSKCATSHSAEMFLAYGATGMWLLVPARGTVFRNPDSA